MAASACRPWRTARSRTMDLSAVRAAPGVVDVLTGARHSRRERHLADRPPRRAGARRRRRCSSHGQPIFCVIAETREQARRACRLAKIEYERTAVRHRRRRPRSRATDKLVTPPLTLKRGDAADAIASGAAPAEGPDAHRRAGPFLSRRPYRAGHSRRGRRRHRLFLDAASERGAAHGRRMCSACRAMR